MPAHADERAFEKVAVGVKELRFTGEPVARSQRFDPVFTFRLPTYRQRAARSAHLLRHFRFHRAGYITVEIAQLFEFRAHC